MKVVENLSVIERKIQEACERSNRNREDIHIIAVTKYVSPERTIEAAEAGINHIGENRIEGLINKQQYVKEGPKWHFIGSLQTRKVKDVVDHVDYIHSLDRVSLAKEIQKRAKEQVPCFVQVNASGEESKHGLAPEEVIPFIHQLQEEGFDKILVVGLMTMAPFVEDETILRSCFQTMKSLQQEVMNLHIENAPCKELSMGMSNDFEIAIEEGSTYIRIGTALVGEDS
ncbi:YggS family pyridoxal phosphate-dependent enzyme [Bacillus massiliigorillae]|uniref:YggS family pyridoxal phosphate-dependent enzyme n=1 Tax=Bacillus massiliigorillae TaxID=1243664 RepID=UPI0003A4CDB2|nr:YggS family pyridoxal phosphate-dependent enzyme [Bacillus massiliigorillae]